MTNPATFVRNGGAKDTSMWSAIESVRKNKEASVAVSLRGNTGA